MDYTILLLASAGAQERALVAALTRRGHRAAVVSKGGDAVDALRRQPYRLVIIALPIPDMSVTQLTRELSEVAAGLSFIITGRDGEVRGGAEAFELGAQDYIADPFAEEHDFLASVGVALGSRRGDVHLRYLRDKTTPPIGWSTVLSTSPSLAPLVETLRKVCLRTSQGATPSILLQGETGTGKGFFARCIHNNGARRNKPFVDINCAALPPSLIESELFGHERGSFTDAKASRAGLFETADGGTLFLDEIAAVPLDLQAKLLTALEEKVVRRIGARAGVKVNVQVIAATHEDLPTMVRKGRFREDLYHRLNVVAVHIPSLRERADDIVSLAESFLSSICAEYGVAPRVIGDDAEGFMREYEWPGNVRELRNQLERIVLLESPGEVRAEHFRRGASSSRPPPESVRPSSDGSSRPPQRAPSTLPPVEVSGSGGALRVSLPQGGVNLELLEREVLREALSRCDGNVSKAARFLSITRQTMIYRMKKHNLG